MHDTAGKQLYSACSKYAYALRLVPGMRFCDFMKNCQKWHQQRVLSGKAPEPNLSPPYIP